MKKFMLVLVVLIISVPVFGLDISFQGEKYIPIDSDTESNWSAQIKVRTGENLWFGVGIENGQRNFIVELYEYDLYSISAQYIVPLNDKLSTFVQLAYYQPHVQPKNETTREGFSMLNTELKTALPHYDRIDISLDPGFGAEIGLTYSVSDHINFLIACRMLELDEHLMGYYGSQNSWIEGSHNFSGFKFGVQILF